MKIMLRSPKKLQTVKGFGTSSCWWSQYCAGNAANELSELLYGKDGLGLNIYRYNVGGGFDPDNNRVENMWAEQRAFMTLIRQRKRENIISTATSPQESL